MSPNHHLKNQLAQVISALTKNDRFKEAVELFYKIHRGCGLALDGFTFGTLLAACGNLGWLRQGREVHAKVVTSGICGNVVVESSLLDMYGKCGSVGQSRIVFDRTNNKNSVSLTAMLGTYCHNREYETVLNLFRENGIVDIYSFRTILRAFSGLAAARQGKEVHFGVLFAGALAAVFQLSRRIDPPPELDQRQRRSPYLGSIRTELLFLSMQIRNLITWNSMIGGFAQNGRGMVAFALFEDMVKGGMQPNYIIFINVLFACSSHTGLVNEGREYFTLMTKKYEIQPGVEHYNCMIDLLGRAELIEDVEILLENSDCREYQSLWAVLFGACTRTVGRWNDALAIRKLMEDRGIKKMPGKSWIESENQKRSHFDLTNMNIAGKHNTL
ncbi:Pentatricopeptide repeat-containing protein [Arachis hypogaea]|nr:Pentatricopeptide repeat-containing protein [Arachis hypogaea]